MLGQRRRRWPNIKTTLVQRLLFAGIWLLQMLPLQFQDATSAVAAIVVAAEIIESLLLLRQLLL